MFLLAPTRIHIGCRCRCLLVLLLVVFVEWTPSTHAQQQSAYSLVSWNSTQTGIITGSGQSFSFAFLNTYFCGYENTIVPTSKTDIVVRARALFSGTTSSTTISFSFSSGSIQLTPSTTGCRIFFPHGTMVGAVMPSAFQFRNGRGVRTGCAAQDFVEVTLKAESYLPGIARYAFSKLNRLTFPFGTALNALSFSNLTLGVQYFMSVFTTFRGSASDSLTVSFQNSTGSFTLLTLSNTGNSFRFEGLSSFVPIPSHAVNGSNLQLIATTSSSSSSATSSLETSVLVVGIEILTPSVVQEIVISSLNQMTNIFGSDLLSWSEGNSGSSISGDAGGNVIKSSLSNAALLYTDGSTLTSPVLNNEEYMTFRPSGKWWIATLNVRNLDSLEFLDGFLSSTPFPNTGVLSGLDTSFSSWTCAFETFASQSSSLGTSSSIYVSRMIIAPIPASSDLFQVTRSSAISFSSSFANLRTTGRVYVLVFGTAVPPSSDQMISLFETFLYEKAQINIIPTYPPPPSKLPILIGVLCGIVVLIIGYWAWKKLKRCVRHQKFSRYIDARRKAEERDAYLVSHDVEREALRNKISELNDRISSPESPYVAYSAHDSVRLPPPSGSAIDSSSSGIPGPSRFRNPETASRFQLVAPSPSMAEEARRLAQLRSPAQTSVSLLDPTSGNEESIFENVVVSPLPDSRPPPFYSKS